MGGEDLRALLTSLTPDEEQLLYDAACEVRRSVYGTVIAGITACTAGFVVAMRNVSVTG